MSENFGQENTDDEEKGRPREVDEELSSVDSNKPERMIVFSPERGFDFSGIPLPDDTLSTKQFASFLDRQTNPDYQIASSLIPPTLNVDNLTDPVGFLASIAEAPPPKPFPNLGVFPTHISFLSTTSKKQKDNTSHRCTCHSTSCLKCYCICFKSGRLCSSECACNNCKNREGFEEEVRQAVNKVREAHPITTCTPKNPNIMCTPSNIGCKCKKECRKNYCDCRRSNHCCSKLCSCENCWNDKFLGELPPSSAAETAIELEQRGRRKRKTALAATMDLLEDDDDDDEESMKSRKSRRMKPPTVQDNTPSMYPPQEYTGLEYFDGYGAYPPPQIDQMQILGNPINSFPQQTIDTTHHLTQLDLVTHLDAQQQNQQIAEYATNSNINAESDAIAVLNSLKNSD